MDIAFRMRFRMIRIEHEHVVELLRALAAVLEHNAHSRVAVYIGVLTLNVGVLRICKCYLLVSLHEAGIHLAAAGSLVTIKYVSLCCGNKTVVHQHLFYDVLDMLDVRDLGTFHFQDGYYLFSER